MIYQDISFRICFSLFGWKENIPHKHCYWQTVPSQWGGGRLWRINWFFLTKTAVTRERKKVGSEQSLKGLQTGHRPKLGSYDKNGTCVPTIDISGPKKAHFFPQTMFWPRQEKVVQRKKLPFPQINISIRNCACFFLVKMHFQPKKHFSAERKISRFSVIPARTGSVVTLGHFFDGPDGPIKIKGTYTSEVGMAQNGEKQGWALKKDPLLENEFFWGGGSNGKVVAPGILVMCPADKNRDYHTKKWLFAPNIQIVGQKSTFSPLATNWSLTNQCFNAKKGVSLVSWYEGAKSFTLSPQKNWFFGPKTDKFGP